MSILRPIIGPKYNGKYLKRIVKEKLGGIRLHETLTSVVIPTFDIKSLQPTIFSTYEVAIALSLTQFKGRGCVSRLILRAMVFRINQLNMHVTKS